MRLAGVLGQVDNGTESASGAGNRDHPDFGGIVHHQQGLVEFPGQRRAEGVHLGGAV
jgi:hypothetical protein